MATILKAPGKTSKGVVVFTTQERDKLIFKNRAIENLVENLKKDWVTGLHHNWHDYKLKYNPLFDFHMAGLEDLKEINGITFPIIDLDACNFVPQYFSSTGQEKFWDILYVARAVYFKKIPEFFQAIKNLYEKGKHYRVLFICPMPPFNVLDTRTAFYSIRREYEKLFTQDEQDLFNLLNLNFRYPFPFDLETLAYFYRSSKVFVHTANDERRCRVAAYAWASGLPVVSMASVGSLLPPKLRTPPYFYEVESYGQFPEKTIEAVENKSLNHDWEQVRNHFLEEKTKVQLIKKLSNIFKSKSIAFETKYLSLANLDIRLGRHVNLGQGKNKINLDMNEFLRFISKNHSKLRTLIVNQLDPERYLEKLLSTQND